MATYTSVIRSDDDPESADPYPDYTTISAWEADLDDSSVGYADGDIAIGLCYDDSDFAENVIINGGEDIDEMESDALSQVKLTAASGHRHDGTYAGANGVKVTSSFDGSQIQVLSKLSAGVIIEDLIVENTHADGNGIVVGSVGTLTSAVVRRNIVKALGSWGINLASTPYDASETPTGENESWNNVAYGGSDYGLRSMTGSQGQFYNNSTHGAGSYGILAYANWTIKNNISTSGTTGDFVYQTGATRDYNLSSDSSADGTNSLTSKSGANQFVSLTGGSENFLLKSGADAINAGVDLGAGNER